MSHNAPRFMRRRVAVVVGVLAWSGSALTSLAADIPRIAWLTGGHTRSSRVFLSSDEQKLVATGGDKVWRMDDGVLETVNAPRSSGMALSPDGTLVAGTAIGNKIDLWRLSDGEIVRTLTGHSDIVQDLAFSPDGSLVASASRDKSVKVWRVSDGQLIRTLTGHTDMARAVRFSPDGTMVASASQDKTVRIWRVSDGAFLGSLTGHTQYVGSLAFSSDSTLIATTSGDKTVRVWRVSDRVLLATLTGHDWPAVAVEFTPDSTFVVSAGIDWTVRVWRLSNFTQERVIPVDAYPNSLYMFADSQRVAVGTDGNPRIIRLADGAELARYGGFTQPITSVVLSPDGAWIAAAELDTLEQRLHMLDANSGKVVSTLTINQREQFEEISPLAISPDWSMFATRNAGGREIYIRDLQDGSLLHTLTGHVSVIYEVAFSPDGQYLASAGEYQSGLWRVSDGQFIRFFEDNFGTGFHSVTFSPDSVYVAAGAIDQGKIWRVSDGALIAGFSDPGQFFVETLAWSPDGTLLASGGSSQSVSLFNPDDGSLVRSLPGHTNGVTQVTFTANGKQLFVSGLDGHIRVWNPATGASLFDMTRGMGRRVNSVAASSNGRQFTYGSDDVFVGFARTPLRTAEPTRR